MTGSHNKYRTLKAIEELILQHMDQNDFEEAQRVLAWDYKQLVVVYKKIKKDELVLIEGPSKEYN